MIHKTLPKGGDKRMPSLFRITDLSTEDHPSFSKAWKSKKPSLCAQITFHHYIVHFINRGKPPALPGRLAEFDKSGNI